MDSRTPQDEAARRLDVFLRWLEEGGARFPKLRIVTREDGERAVLSQVDISAFQEVLQLPTRLLMTHQQALESEFGRLIHAHAGPVKEQVYLITFLLAEKQRGDSFWKPYLDTLPESFPHLPLYYSEAERALLQGTFVVELLEHQQRELLAEYASLCERVPGFQRFAAEDFLWACVAVSSRSFDLTVDGVTGRCMVPLGDMLNHQNPPECVWACSGERFVMMAQRAVPSGLEVHDSYGAKDNDMLLLHYGFVLESNADDTVMLRLSLPEGDALAAEKQQRLGLSMPDSRCLFKVPPHSESPAARDLFSFLRIACAGPEELNRLTTPDAPEPLSVATEERVLHALGTACEARLAGFDTTLEEDERLLREERLSSNARNCILLRRGEKRMLRAYADLVRTCLPLLRMPAAELEQLATRPGASSWGMFDGYVRKAVLPAVRHAGQAGASVAP